MSGRPIRSHSAMFGAFLVAVVLGLAVLGLARPAFAATPISIQNPGFEDNDRGADYWAAGWAHDLGFDNQRMRQEYAHTGSWGAGFGNAGSRDQGAWSGGFQDKAISGGGTYRLSVWATGNDAPVTKIMIEWFNGGQLIGATEARGSRFGVSSADWTKMTVSGTAPPLANKCRLWLQITGGTTGVKAWVFYDDVTFEALTPPALAYSDFSISPGPYYVGDTVSASITILNTGDVAGQWSVVGLAARAPGELNRDFGVVGRSLGPNESFVLTLSRNITEPGYWYGWLFAESSGAGFPVAGPNPAFALTAAVRPVVTPQALGTTTRLSGSSSGKRKKTYKLSGTVSPAAPGRVTIAMTRKVGRKWKSAGHVHVNLASGRFSYSFKPRYRGYWRFLASYPGGIVAVTTYTSSKSATKSVRVK